MPQSGQSDSKSMAPDSTLKAMASFITRTHSATRKGVARVASKPSAQFCPKHSVSSLASFSNSVGQSFSSSGIKHPGVVDHTESSVMTDMFTSNRDKRHDTGEKEDLDSPCQFKVGLLKAAHITQAAFASIVSSHSLSLNVHEGVIADVVEEDFKAIQTMTDQIAELQAELARAEGLISQLNLGRQEVEHDAHKRIRHLHQQNARKDSELQALRSVCGQEQQQAQLELEGVGRALSTTTSEVQTWQRESAEANAAAQMRFAGMQANLADLCTSLQAAGEDGHVETLHADVACLTRLVASITGVGGDSSVRRGAAPGGA